MNSISMTSRNAPTVAQAFCAAACIVLFLIASRTASAQALDPRVDFLTTRMQQLESKVQALENTDARTQQDLASLRTDLSKTLIDLTILKTQVTVMEGVQNQLITEVDALKNRDPSKPAEPGKTPTPNKPTDGQPLTLRAPFIVKDSAGQVIFKVEVAADRNLPRAVVGNPAGAHVEMGPATGGGSTVGLFDSSGKMLSTIVADAKASYVRVQDSSQSAGFGRIEKDGTGMFLRTGDREFAEIAADKTGAGIFRIFGQGGKPVGGMFADSDGGRLALSGTGGGKTIVSLAAEATGGKVRVYPAGGGTTRAELIADGANGAMNIFNTEGTTSVMLATGTTKAGRMELSNASGNIVVQAGVTNNGRGMVSTGPYDAGVAGVVGGMKPASSLLGSLSSK
ncbi:MAG: hypothetical protein WDO56_18650 [Gammaproteobacteria bacterium]